MMALVVKALEAVHATDRRTIGRCMGAEPINCLTESTEAVGMMAAGLFQREHTGALLLLRCQTGRPLEEMAASAQKGSMVNARWLVLIAFIYRQTALL